ncbi:hypothetical protein [Terrisporobacter glycolicus]|uniref:Lipoprotein n=1 Tax=Terrisporobacter glycolicus ATCC 14880 = DSM 1288 TaxID=1121315 RepID=A0ABZ2EUW7_9FIRM|nr:hypothetical protein [Terrisporobacter glycolicus]
MKINNKIIIIMCLGLTLSVGCSSNSEGNKNDSSVENIENHIPYVNDNMDEIDNSIVDERYENVKKEELSYDNKEEGKEVSTEVHPADSIKDDTSYKSILLGFTYFSEINPTNVPYDKSIELVKKVLPDDIKQVALKKDKEVNKEYIYYESTKGNFRVGLCYGYEFNDENEEIVSKDKIVGIDYSKEIK